MRLSTQTSLTIYHAILTSSLWRFGNFSARLASIRMVERSITRRCRIAGSELCEFRELLLTNVVCEFDFAGCCVQ